MVYYQKHPSKKQLQNRKRYQLQGDAAAKAVPPIQAEKATSLLSYVCLLVSLVELRVVGLDEIRQMLEKKERQHRMEKCERRSYGGPRATRRGS